MQTQVKSLNQIAQEIDVTSVRVEMDIPVGTLGLPQTHVQGCSMITM